MYFKYVIFCLLLCSTVYAQEELPLRELIENNAENLPEDYDFEEWVARLEAYRKHPLSINKASKEDWQNLSLLTPVQIHDLLRHIQDHGEFIDIAELYAVDGLDSATIQRMMPYITLKESSGTKGASLAQASHELLLRYGRIIETQKGFQKSEGSYYTGSPDKLLIRYKYRLEKRLNLSLLMEKDAGEPFRLAPMDFASASLFIVNLGFIQKLAIGDYGLQFGQGLNLWSGFAFGKSPEMAGMVKAESGLKAYTSANESAFFRGLAMKIQPAKYWSVQPFWSSRKLDASGEPGDGNAPLHSLLQTGYHRTPTEREQAGNVRQVVYGLASDYTKDFFSIGTSVYRVHFNKDFEPGNAPYQRFNFHGNSLFNAGIHYNFSYKNLFGYGEVAKSTPGGMAWMQGLLLSLSKGLSLSLFYRDYQKNYYNFFSQAPADGNGTNENGVYTGFQFQPSKKWQFAAYADVFQFPWLKYRVDAPSQGHEYLTLFRYNPNKKWHLSFRTKWSSRQENTDAELALKTLDEVRRSSLRLELFWQVLEKFSLESRIERTRYVKENGIPEWGSLLAQDLSYRPAAGYLFNMRFAYFMTPSYNSRIYAYEKDVLYLYGFGLYNGRGFRSYANLRIGLGKQADIWLRYARSWYPGASSVGTGLDEITGNSKSDLRLQLRYQF